MNAVSAQARRAGLAEIPLIEMEVSPRDALEIALVENLQRADLTPFEEAEGLRTLVARHGYTHDRVAATVGRSRVSVTESLGLLRMPGGARETATGLGVASSKSILLEVMKLGSEASMIRDAGTDRRARPDVARKFAPRSGNGDLSRMSHEAEAAAAETGATRQEAGMKASRVPGFGRAMAGSACRSASGRRSWKRTTSSWLSRSFCPSFGGAGTRRDRRARRQKAGAGRWAPPAVRAWPESDNVHYVNSIKEAGYPGR